MNFKFLKATFASLLILTSTANAGVIDIDFTALAAAGDINSVKNQDVGSYDVVDDILTLGTNSWFSIDILDIVGDNSIDYANTVLSFDFLTTGTAEIAGVAASAIKYADIHKSLNLIGTDNWGIQDIEYTDVNEWVHFDISLDEYMTGDFSKIVFINDCDNCDGLDITASFKNMSIVDVPEPATLAIFALGLLGLVSRRVKK